MKLQYKVLWFDDSEDLLDSIDWDYLNEQITEWGFMPQFTKVTTATDFIAQSPFQEYDLIVVDFNLYGKQKRLPLQQPLYFIMKTLS